MTTSRDGMYSALPQLRALAIIFMALPGLSRTQTMQRGFVLSTVRPVSTLHRSWHQRWHLLHRRRPLV